MKKSETIKKGWLTSLFVLFCVSCAVDVMSTISMWKFLHYFEANPVVTVGNTTAPLLIIGALIFVKAFYLFLLYRAFFCEKIIPGLSFEIGTYGHVFLIGLMICLTVTQFVVGYGNYKITNTILDEANGRLGTHYEDINQLSEFEINQDFFANNAEKSQAMKQLVFQWIYYPWFVSFLTFFIWEKTWVNQIRP